MNCRDFSDIADSYLSNELLVETNHDVLRHLESCRDCRELLGVRREIRERLRTSVKNAEESTIDPQFAYKIKAVLGNEAVRPRFATFRLRFVAVGFAAVMLIATMVFFVVRVKNDGRQTANMNPDPAPSTKTVSPGSDVKPIPAVLIEAADDAIDDHKNCALNHNLAQKPISLEEAAKKVDVVNAGFDKVVIAALKDEFGEQTRLIKAHYCLINGRYFTHVVLESKKRIFSVLMTKLKEDEAENNEPLVCNERDGLKSVCVASNGYALFVVSDSSEDDNLTIARIILNPVREHLTKGRIAI